MTDLLTNVPAEARMTAEEASNIVLTSDALMRKAYTDPDDIESQIARGVPIRQLAITADKARDHLCNRSCSQRREVARYILGLQSRPKQERVARRMHKKGFSLVDVALGLD